jgi:UPF0716 protein FxsA
MPSFKSSYSMRSTLGPIELPKKIIIGIGLWCAAEFCAFALVVSYLGLSGALLLGLATTVIGFSLLRRLGRDAASNLRQVFGGEGLVLQQGKLLDGGFAAFGAVLLILPGFLSDLIGLALSAPSIRFWLADRLKGKKATHPFEPAYSRDQIIDLGAQEWRRVDEPGTGFRGQH